MRRAMLLCLLLVSACHDEDDPVNMTDDTTINPDGTCTTSCGSEPCGPNCAGGVDPRGCTNNNGTWSVVTTCADTTVLVGQRVRFTTTAGPLQWGREPMNYVRACLSDQFGDLRVIDVRPDGEVRQTDNGLEVLIVTEYYQPPPERFATITFEATALHAGTSTVQTELAFPKPSGGPDWYELSLEHLLSFPIR